jgi:flagellar biosynthesis protein FliR
VNVDAWLPAALALARLTPLALWASRAGSWLFPGPVAFSLASALALYFGALAGPSGLGSPTPAALSLLLVRELLLGVALCFGVAAPFSALSFAQRALGRALGGGQGESLPRWLALASGALLFRLAIDRALLRLVASVFRDVPFGQALSFAALPGAAAALVAHAAGLALALLLPFLASLLLVDGVLALAQRWFARAPEPVADLPLRALGVVLVLGSALVSFADRVPGLVRGAFALVGPLLGRLLR